MAAKITAAKILAIANQKGGVGKTTTSINLAASLARMQQRVLLVDLDPQGNATMGSGVNKAELERGVYEVLTHQCSAKEAIVALDENGFAVLPANGDLTAAEVELIDAPEKEQRLKQALAPESDHYDYILIDCPPSLNMLTLNALVAAHGVLIPMQCEYFALEGLSALSDTISGIAASVNPGLAIEGLVRTMFDPRNRLTVEVSDQLKQFFGELVYRTVIPRNVRLAEAPSYGLPIIVYDKNSTGALAYLALAGELVRRQGRHSPEPDTDNNGSAYNNGNSYKGS
ncbi:MAG: ParA family protein [Pseudomonadales bacterium]|jgi:chromosome partitioning protein|nr:ParA family protein [Pseudomonadales bacterium]